MISLLLWALAPIANALMDIVENENFMQSIFHKKEKTLGLRWDLFWYKRESWKHARKMFGYKFDAWHAAKSIMIVSIILSTICFKFEGFMFDTKSLWYNIVSELVIRGLVWNLLFILFYHRIFRLKQYKK